MADGGYFLTPDDRDVVQRMIESEARRWRGRASVGEGAGDVDDQEVLAPEVYVARTPAGGIPALNEGFTSWTGTGTTTHAGTGTELLEDDSPGEADCAVWQTVRSSAGTPYLVPMDSYPHRVLNLSATAVPGDTWILIARTKEGEWYAVQGGGGGGGSIDVCGVAHQDDTGTGTDTECPVEPDRPFLITDPLMLKFSKDFQLTELPDGDCETSTTGTGSGTHGDGRKTAFLETRGYSGTVVMEVNPIWCASICDLMTQQLTFCIEHGRVVDVFFGAAPECP